MLLLRFLPFMVVCSHRVFPHPPDDLAVALPPLRIVVSNSSTPLESHTSAAKQPVRNAFLPGVLSLLLTKWVKLPTSQVPVATPKKSNPGGESNTYVQVDTIARGFLGFFPGPYLHDDLLQRERRSVIF